MSEIIAQNGGDARTRHTVVLDPRVSLPASQRSWTTHVRHQQHTRAFYSYTRATQGRHTSTRDDDAAPNTTRRGGVLRSH